MYIFIFIAVAFAFFVANAMGQAQRIQCLGRHASQFQIEKLMETTIDGYLRALGESDPERQSQVLNLLATSEQSLRQQIQALAQAFSSETAEKAQFSTLPWALPYASQLFPRHCADMRALLQVHAQGVASVLDPHFVAAPKDRAYMLTAELLLFQHSCHWYCRSRSIANARVLARHHTPHAQLLAHVHPTTRRSYQALISR
jgi:hypothetical protein